MMVARQTGHEWWPSYSASPQRINAALHYGPEQGIDAYSDATLTDRGNCERVASAIDLGGSIFSLRVVAGAASLTEAYSDRSRATRVRAGGAAYGAVAERARVHGSEVELTDLARSPLTRREASTGQCGSWACIRWRNWAP